MSTYFGDLGWLGRPDGPRDGDEGLDDDLWWEDDPREPTPPLRLDPTQESALAQAVATGLRERGCDHTLRAAQDWAACAGVGWAGLRAGLEGRGGYCDCEVLLNVLPTDDLPTDHREPP